MRIDTRGQVVQVAALLAFAFAVLAFASYQATVVPQETAQAEQDHSEQTKTDLQQVERAIERTATSGASSSATVRMAPRYPNRILAMNPSRGSGSLRTIPLINNEPISDRRGIAIENAVYPDSSDERHDRWNGTELVFETNRLEYRADYNRFQNPPTRVYEQSLSYNAFENGAVVVNSEEQRVIDGTTIRLTALRGELDTSGPQTRTVGLDAVSGPTESISVTGDNENITLTLLTNLSRDDWEEALAEEEHARVGGFSTGGKFNELVIELDGSQVYDLRLGAVGIGRNVPDSEATYIVDVRGNGTRVPEGATVGITTEVRDEYDNSFTGEEIEAEAFDETLTTTNAGAVREPSKASRSNGQATFVYDAPDDVNGEETYYVGTSIGDTDPGGTLTGTIDSLIGNPERALFAITVYEPTTEGGFQVTIIDTNSPVEEGDVLTVTAEVENTGNQPQRQEIDLYIEGVGVVNTTETENIAGGDSEEVTLGWQTESGDAGTYNAEVRSEDDSDSTDVTVEQFEGPSFESLTAEVTDETGGLQGGSPSEVTFRYEVAQEEEITFTVQNPGDNTNSETVIGTQGEVVVVVPQPGRDYPLTVSGKITNGEYCESTINENNGVVNVCE
jgi:hypothetical protein